MTNEILACEIRRVIAEMIATPMLKEQGGRICLVPKNLLERLTLYSGALASRVLHEDPTDAPITRFDQYPLH